MDALPTIHPRWTTPAAIDYGTALSTAQLNAISTIAGTFSYFPAAGTVLRVGAQTVIATFTSTDTTDYTTATASEMVNVTRTTPSVDWATPAPIVYGTGLSSAQLNASSNVPGGFGAASLAAVTAITSCGGKQRRRRRIGPAVAELHTNCHRDLRVVYKQLNAYAYRGATDGR